MLQSDYDDVSGQQFTVKVTKEADGTYTASSKNAPELGSFKGRTQQIASRAANDALAKFARDGYKVKK